VPTILRFDGLRVAIYPNDHRPPHVHVLGASGEALFLLNCPAGQVSLRENYGFKGRDLNRIAMELNTHLDRLCEAWEEIHDYA
jgi:hypothetical protein